MIYSILKNFNQICQDFNQKYIWYLSAIEIIDTHVARRGRQYHRNPPPYKNRPTKKNRIYKIKRPPPPPPPPPNPTQPTPHHTTTTAQTNPTQRNKKFQLAKVVKITKYQNI